ncbi:hypothetical protein [Qiania dongpingensis]|uniref:Uncharacterized protein n=1 Tax=Qiania dongpingensis TaxID=2763669 RepID=A0A7G9G7B8_9FIRM|nr:hypothetical protein [Qiania dongpingensis]QNM06700.1 hypothetical protein H9Q78_06190 [Qiania dongpingensis]
MSYHIHSNFISGKTFLVFLLLFLYVRILTGPIKAASVLLGVPVAPWLFPFLNNRWNHQLIFVILAMFLFSEAPYRNRNAEYVISRAGRISYTVGQYFYIIFLAFIFTIAIYIFSIISVLPHIGWSSGWGTVIRTLCATDFGRQTGLSLEMTQSIVVGTEAVFTTLKAMVLQWGCIGLVGMLIRTLNSFSPKYPLGIICMLVISLLDFLTANLLNYKFYYFSPVSLARLSALGKRAGKNPTLTYALLFYLFSCMACVVIGVVYAKWEGGRYLWKRNLKLL